MIIIKKANLDVLNIFREFENNEDDIEYMENILKSFIELKEKDV